MLVIIFNDIDGLCIDIVIGRWRRELVGDMLVRSVELAVMLEWINCAVKLYLAVDVDFGNVVVKWWIFVLWRNCGIGKLAVGIWIMFCII